MGLVLNVQRGVTAHVGVLAVHPTGRYHHVNEHQLRKPCPVVHDICVAYSAREQFVAEALRFLLEGLRRHRRVGFLGAVPSALLGELAPLGDVAALRSSGALFVGTIDEAYDVDDVGDVCSS